MEPETCNWSIYCLFKWKSIREIACKLRWMMVRLPDASSKRIAKSSAFGLGELWIYLTVVPYDDQSSALAMYKKKAL